jgi:hypothetical protein
MLVNRLQSKDAKTKDFAKKQKKKLFEKIQRGKLYDSNLVLSTSKKRMKRYIAGLQFV